MLPHPSLGRVWLARGDPGIPLCTAPICQFLVGLSSNVVVCSKFALPWVQEVRNHRVYQHKLCFDEVIAAVAVTLLLVQQHLIKTKVTTLDETMVAKWVLSGYYRLEAQHLLAQFMLLLQGFLLLAGYSHFVNWAIPFNKGTPPMDNRVICLPWDRIFVLTPLGQTVVYGELRKIYWNLQGNTEIS